ncbi:aminotransferase class I/II-fold pyridoxal phosphate-dependent enzyme [Arthrobacter sp.]|uniref:DegT/DnrJ/EryC1/StrS family aminotransferase n=1 Tax=Arthrobacter sp. TaxID=1667 RepID=UPI00339532FC
MNIPLVDLQAQHHEIAGELMPALDELLTSAALIGGFAVSRFEAAYARAMSVSHCVGVANGTDALELALRAVGVRRGDEVILPANTFIATAEAVVRIGAQPVLVDVDPMYLLIDPRAVPCAVTSRTRAIVPVHLFGQVAPMEDLAEIAEHYGLKIVEDAAQAHGAGRYGHPLGSHSHMVATSFYPGKNLGAAGDAGAVTTNDESLAASVRMLAAHGSRTKYVHEAMGMNSRLDAVQAVVLDIKLRRLGHWNHQRRVAASYYHELLAQIPEISLPATAEGNVDAWHLYVVRTRDRNRILKELNAAGIQAGVHYPVPLHLTEAWSRSKFPNGSFPVAERASEQILSLPLFPHITPEQQRRVAASLTAAIQGGGQ